MSISTLESRQSVRMLDAADAAQAACDKADETRAYCVSRTRHITEAIKALDGAFFTTDSAAAIVAALSDRIAKSNWSHTAVAELASTTLDELHDDLEGSL
jgi:hypothetical protein